MLAFEIVSEEGVAAGTRRIAALTGKKAEAYGRRIQETLDQAAALLHVSVGEVIQAVRQLQHEIRDLKKAVNAGAAPPEQAAAALPIANRSLDAAQRRMQLRETARALNAALFDAPERISALLEERARLRHQVEQLRTAGDFSAEGPPARARKSAT